MPSTTVPMPVRAGGPPGPRRARAKVRRRRAGIAGLVVLLLGAGGAWAWWNGSVGPVTVREHCTATAGGKLAELDPEQAGNAAIIAGVANRRGLPARATSIGIATAIQESKLRNITYGDRDSLGLFQQRPSQGWGTRKEILDPVYAANAFYDVLAKVDGYRDMPITDVAQEVQRSAFPSAYADHEPEARIIASALSGYSPAGLTCALRDEDLTAQRPGGSGFTARAAAVRRAADRETGRTSPQPQDDGTTLRYTVPRGEDNRAGWSLGHWAVARAGALHVSRVQVDGRVWLRSSSRDGWTKATDALPAGQVAITVG
jgi:hypothetical protein